MSSFWVGASLFLFLLLFVVSTRKNTRPKKHHPTSRRPSSSYAPLFFLAFVDLLFAAGVFGWMLDIDVHQASTAARFLPPAWPHLLGTDELSRDVLLRLLFGGRFSLSVALVAGGVSTLSGILFGSIAASVGGKVDDAFLRLCEVAVSMPALPLLLLLVAIPSASFSAIAPPPWVLSLAVVVVGAAGFAAFQLPHHRVAYAGLASLALIFLFIGSAFLAFSRGQGPSAAALRIVLLLCAFSWVRAARLARAEILRLMQSELLWASKALGAPWHIRWRTLFLPHLQWIFFSVGALECASVFLAEAALSYLGFGLQPPWSSWGRMLLGALERVHHHPLQAFLPALCIVTCAFFLQRVGEGLRKAMDPNDI
ncbi:MAG: ABC transporter permease [Deltaproteobacteria bacterium]|nr:ABC transporter permease [Deltaproteobacteria bacterium]